MKNSLLAKLLTFGFMGFYLVFTIWQLSIVDNEYKGWLIFLAVLDIVFIIVFAVWFYKKDQER